MQYTKSTAKTPSKETGSIHQLFLHSSSHSLIISLMNSYRTPTTGHPTGFLTTSLLGLVCLLASETSSAITIDHTFSLTLRHSSGITFAVPPTQIALQVDAPGTAGGPLYQGQTTTGTNILYEPGSAPGSPGSVISVSFTLEETSFLHQEGIIHRDIAARNFVVNTDEGPYEAEAGRLFFFTNSGPEDLRGVGPVRWMSPESIRSKEYSRPANSPLLSTSSAQSGYWEMVGGSSFFDVSYPIPEPSSFLLLGIGLSIGLLKKRC